MNTRLMMAKTTMMMTIRIRQCIIGSKPIETLSILEFSFLGCIQMQSIRQNTLYHDRHNLYVGTHFPQTTHQARPRVLIYHT
jgi:hypothetical protein